MRSTSTPEEARPQRPDEFPGRSGRRGAIARVVRSVDRLSDGLDRLATWGAAGFLLVMVAAVAVQVFFRFVLENSLSWSEELSRYCFVWLSLLGASTALKRGMHPALGGLGRVLPARLQPLIFTLCKLAAGFVLFVLFSEGVELARFNMRQTSPAMGVPMGIPYGAIPVASALMLVHLLSSLLHFDAALSAPADGEPSGRDRSDGGREGAL